MKLLRKFFSLTFLEKKLLLKALFLSLVVKLIVKLLPMRWYKRILEYPGTPVDPISPNEKMVYYVSAAVNRSSRYAPWRTRCLVDAITAKLLLQHYHIRSTLFLGVSKEGKNSLIAHAWLKYNDIFITGKRGYQKFTVVSSFT